MADRPDAVGVPKPGSISIPASLSVMSGELKATTHAIRDVLSGTAMIAEQTQRFYGQAEEMARATLEIQKQFRDDFRSMTNEFVSSMRVSTVGLGGDGGGKDMSRPAEPVPHIPRAAVALDQPEGMSPRSEHGRQLLTGPWAGPVADEGGMDYLRRMQGYNLTTARADAGRWAQDRIGQWAQKELPDSGSIPQMIPDDLGNEQWFRPDGSVITDAGEIFDARLMADDYATRAASATGRIAALGRSVSQQGLGRGLTSALPSGAIKAAGVVGAGYAVATQVRDFANAQREANASWQRALGGSNAEGFGERAGQRMFEMGQSWFGGMGGGMAGQLYQGAAEIYGIDRAQRRRVENFGSEMWRSHGMTVEDSLALVETASQNGNDSLEGLATAIDRVSESAREAGVNAGAAVQAFSDTYRSVSGTLIGGGAGAVGISGAIAQTVTSMGRGLSDLDLSGLTSQTSMYQQANALGVDPGVYWAQVNGPGGAGVWARGAAAQMQGITSQAFTPEQMAYVQRRVSESGSNPAALGEIAVELAENYGWRPDAAVQYLQAAGIQAANPADAVLAVVEAGSGSLPGQLIDNADQYVRDRTERSVTDALADEGLPEDDWRRRAYTGDESIGGQYEWDAQSGQFDWTPSGGADSQGEWSGKRRDRALYEAWVQRTGKTNPVVESLLAEGTYSTNRRYAVETADGTKQITLGEAIQHDYLDQFYRGDVMISGGDGEGQTLGEFLPSIDALAPGEAGGTTIGGGPSSSRDATVGDAIDQDDIEGIGGRVLIDLSPAARAFFTANPPNVLIPPSGSQNSSSTGLG